MPDCVDDVTTTAIAVTTWPGGMIATNRALPISRRRSPHQLAAAPRTELIAHGRRSLRNEVRRRLDEIQLTARKWQQLNQAPGGIACSVATGQQTFPQLEPRPRDLPGPFGTRACYGWHEHAGQADARPIRE